jgi:cyclic lactone autoinducer peptide
MKKKIIVGFATVVAFIAVFVAQASAASACFWCWHDPDLPEELK